MSTWLKESNYAWYERLAINIMRSGPVPNHVAFIMDGNRRFATKIHRKKSEGHAKGFEKLSECLVWCLDLGIKEVTVYAFSIENFKRSSEEVETLMSLAREKFQKLLEEKDKLMEKEVCIRIIGNLKLLPLDIQKTVAEVMLMTKDNKKAVLNVAFAYTSREEMSSSMTTILQGVENGDLDARDIDEHLINECLYTRNSTEPDLLLRTSGESRLSDFMLWQSSSTIVHFSDILWPEFSIWHLLGAIFHYQRAYSQIYYVKQFLNKSCHHQKAIENDKVKTFLHKVDRDRHDYLVKLVQ